MQGAPLNRCASVGRADPSPSMYLYFLFLIRWEFMYLVSCMLFSTNSQPQWASDWITQRGITSDPSSRCVLVDALDSVSDHVAAWAGHCLLYVNVRICVMPLIYWLCTVEALFQRFCQQTSSHIPRGEWAHLSIRPSCLTLLFKFVIISPIYWGSILLLISKAIFLYCIIPTFPSFLETDDSSRSVTIMRKSLQIPFHTAN